MKKNMLTVIPFVATAIISIAASAVITNKQIANEPPPPMVVKVDLQTLIRAKTDEVARQATGSELTESQQNAVDTYTKTLDTIINELANAHNLIVVPSQAVVAGAAEDITPIVKEITNDNQ